MCLPQNPNPKDTCLEKNPQTRKTKQKQTKINKQKSSKNRYNQQKIWKNKK